MEELIIDILLYWFYRMPGTIGSTRGLMQLLQTMLNISTIHVDTNIFASPREWHELRCDLTAHSDNSLLNMLLSMASDLWDALYFMLLFLMLYYFAGNDN
jgi:hypothetical protein